VPCDRGPLAELSTSIPLPTDFTATHLLHPQTYLNKVVLGSTSGALALYNIRTRTLLYTFPAPPAVGLSPAAGAVTALAQSPAIDVVAVGYASGLVRLLDLRLDEELLALRMEGAISAIGFRTDGEPILATGSEDGDLALWDLNNRGRLVHLVRTAHEGGVSTVEWISGQSLLVTSGGDNAIRVRSLVLTI
jgi:U3 small nucleolar RNA-associated protein 21